MRGQLEVLDAATVDAQQYGCQLVFMPAHSDVSWCSCQHIQTYITPSLDLFTCSFRIQFVPRSDQICGDGKKIFFTIELRVQM